LRLAIKRSIALGKGPARKITILLTRRILAAADADTPLRGRSTIRFERAGCQTSGWSPPGTDPRGHVVYCEKCRPDKERLVAKGRLTGWLEREEVQSAPFDRMTPLPKHRFESSGLRRPTTGKRRQVQTAIQRSIACPPNEVSSEQPFCPDSRSRTCWCKCHAVRSGCSLSRVPSTRAE
jgi:hypothetical protein